MTDKAQLEADFGVNNGYAPGPEGPRAFGYDVVFPGNVNPVLVDLTLASDLGFIDKAQGIFVDNTGNVGVSIRIPGVEQTVRVPPNAQFVGPIALPRELRQLYLTSNEAKTIRIIIFNVPLPLAVYSTAGGGAASVVTIAGQPISVTFPTPQSVTGPLTDLQLRASPVPVDIVPGDVISITGNVEVTNDVGNPLPVSGSVSVSGSVEISNDVGNPIPVSGTVSVTQTSPGTSTRASVAAAAIDTLILASNANRRGATVYNDSTANLYLALGTVAASTSNFTLIVASNAYYELPFSYTGEVRGIWASATGNARISEMT